MTAARAARLRRTILATFLLVFVAAAWAVEQAPGIALVLTAALWALAVGFLRADDVARYQPQDRW